MKAQSIQKLQPVKKIQRLGLAIAIVGLGYQPAHAELQQLVGPTPTAPTPSQLLAAVVPGSEVTLAQNNVAGAPFISDAKPTQGAAQIVEIDGQHYLEFDEAFRSDAGPDLFVLLHDEATPQSYSPENYINLGRIQELEGAQRYAIPADVDIEAFKSAVIWCRQFNVTFGYATF